MTEERLVCNPSAMTAAEWREHVALQRELWPGAEDGGELDEGTALLFPSDSATLLKLARFIDRERRCCAFARFALRVHDRDRIRLEITGPPGTKEFLAKARVASDLRPES